MIRSRVVSIYDCFYERQQIVRFRDSMQVQHRQVLAFTAMLLCDKVFDTFHLQSYGTIARNTPLG